MMFHLHIFGYFFTISAGGFMSRSLPCSLQSLVFGGTCHNCWPPDKLAIQSEV